MGASSLLAEDHETKKNTTPVCHKAVREGPICFYLYNARLFAVHYNYNHKTETLFRSKIIDKYVFE